jgi:hypothetical protein
LEQAAAAMHTPADTELTLAVLTRGAVDAIPGADFASLTARYADASSRPLLQPTP